MFILLNSFTIFTTEDKKSSNYSFGGGKMKVLITGGYGFIGSHVADQFYKEGYEVHILDNLSSGKKENVQFKHKSYILSVDDPKCRDIFKSYKFDIVVHLAAQVSVAKSVLNPTYDAQTNLVGLTNMLQLAKTHHVKKFIFASSAAVYGDNPNIPLSEQELPQPISPYGISKWAGETYCHNWAASHELETICFRFSNVYGPRQTAEGEGGVIAVYTSKLMHNQPLVVHGDGHQTRDFIFVGDVAFAIYRASKSNVTGTYNLSTNTEVSIHEIIQAFEQIHGTISTTYTEARAADIYRSSLDNTAIKAALDWSPLHSLSEGLQKTYDWAKSSQELEETQKRYDFLEETHTEIHNVNDEFQLRLINNEDSFGIIYSIIKELDDLEPEKVFTNAVQVVEKIMRCKDISIYVFNKHHTYLRLVAHSEISERNTIQNSIKVDETPFIQDMLQNGKIFVNRELTIGLPLLAAPIYYNNEIRFVITINRLSFEQISMYHENLLMVVRELIQSSLGRAFEFIKVTEATRYIENTTVLHYEKFAEIVRAKEEAKANNNMSYTVFTIPTTMEDLHVTANIIGQLLRETDYISYKDNLLYILLSNSTNEHLPSVLQRFNDAGIVDTNEKMHTQ